MNRDRPSRTVIGVRTAIVLYALLIVASFVSLKGNARYIALIIVGALALKSFLHHIRSHME